MDKRTLIALALSFLVLGFYPVVLQKFYPDYYKKNGARSEKPAPSASPRAGTEKLVSAGAFQSDLDLNYRNKNVSLVFNKEDGGVREIAFPRFPDSDTKRPIQFLSLKKIGVSPGSLVLNTDSDATLVKDFTGETAADGATLAAQSGALRVTKSYSFSDKYAGKLTLRFENTGAEPLELGYELLVGSGITPRNSIDSQYIETNFFTGAEEKALKHVKETRLGKQVASQGPVKWVAVKDRHFSVILKPADEAAFTGLARGLGGQDFTASLLSSRFTVPAGSPVEHAFTLYVGPNELETLEPLGLGELVNFGKFDFFGKLFVGSLELLYKLCRNYGLAVVALTTLINVLLFPLTRVSYMSMKRMQLVQPQMTKIREQHKKNPERLNKEMMELYRKHKVNPFGGCLPMVLQIPIFIALYVALSKYVPLINARFLWVGDLSAPDRVYLPFALPFLGNRIHVLPLLMCAAMVVQQRFTKIPTTGQDPAMEQQQKMMAVMMPIVFGFIFYQMPSGLVLYWLTNTMLMLFYQLHLKKMTLTV